MILATSYVCAVEMEMIKSVRENARQTRNDLIKAQQGRNIKEK